MDDTGIGTVDDAEEAESVVVADDADVSAMVWTGTLGEISMASFFEAKWTIPAVTITRRTIIHTITVFALPVAELFMALLYAMMAYLTYICYYAIIDAYIQ